MSNASPLPNLPRGAYLVSRYKAAKRVVARFLTEREVRLATRFRPGDEVKVKPTHGFKEWHGDTGVIDKLVPFNKAYVELKANGRRILDLDHLELISKHSPKLVGVDRLVPGDVIEHESREIEIKGWYPTKDPDGQQMTGFRGRVVAGSGVGGFVELMFKPGAKVKLLRRE